MIILFLLTISPKKRVKNISGLAHRRFAIDSSIWLASFLHAMQNNQGMMMENAHLQGILIRIPLYHFIYLSGYVTLGLYTRIMRLLSLQILPVFVFDGPTHPLKERVLVCFYFSHFKSSYHREKEGHAG